MEQRIPYWVYKNKIKSLNANINELKAQLILAKSIITLLFVINIAWVVLYAIK